MTYPSNHDAEHAAPRGGCSCETCESVRGTVEAMRLTATDRAALCAQLTAGDASAWFVVRATMRRNASK